MLDNDGKYYCEEEGCGRELCDEMLGSWFYQLCTFCFEEKVDEENEKRYREESNG